MIEAKIKELSPIVAPIARVLLALMFVMAAVSKIEAYEGTQAYMDGFGIPGALLPLVIITEFFGGLAIMVGFQVRTVGLALAGFTLMAAAVFHSNFADQVQMLLFMKNISVAGGLLLLVVHGAGQFSLESRNAG